MIVTDNVPTADNLKTLHKTIKVADDIENFSSILRFHNLCVNELTAQGCHSRAVLTFCRYFPYAPHIAEELWSVRK
jgi:leucyl-tRNA synthetase